MTVYVDDLFVAVAVKADARAVSERNRNRWCHLMADSLEELHAFAQLLGLKRNWFQGDHYDLTPSRRRLAVAKGAQQVSARFLVQVRRKLRGGA